MRGFFDGNGDGSGDFRGLIEKLDYLQWLGIDCIWLLPMYASPLRDGGYDIADYYAVHPDYGTIEDVRDVHRGRPPARHARDRRPRHEPHLVRPPVVPGGALEPGHPQARLVRLVGHRRTATRTRGSSSSTPRPRTGPGTSRPARTTGTASSPTSPTSTTTTPRSRRRCSTRCASGSTSGSTASASTPCPTSSSARARTARTCPRRTSSSSACARTVDDEYPDRVLLAEANQWPADVVEYFGDGDECHMAFHFPVMPRMFMALRREEATPILEILDQTPRDPRELPVGPLPAQPRRADARDGHRRGARLHVRGVREGPAHEAQRRASAAGSRRCSTTAATRSS